MKMNSHTPSGFEMPTQLPDTEAQKKEWQQNNLDWWESHPMRYDWAEEIEPELYSKDYFLEIDKRFFADAKRYMPYEVLPFERLIPYTELPHKDVLEIGVGQGSHAQLLAQHSKSYCGVDLTKFAVVGTRKRFEIFNIDATILQMDAEEMSFDDNAFDFVWSWGVIHHSSNTKNILQQIHRVLRPGGIAITMVYFRNWWNYYVMNGLFRGVFRGDLLKTRSLSKTVQRHTDGAIARFYTKPEWNALVSDYFVVEKNQIYGGKAELLPLPPGKIKENVINAVPDNLSRKLTNEFNMGSFLVSTLRRKD